MSYTFKVKYFIVRNDLLVLFGFIWHASISLRNENKKVQITFVIFVVII